MIKHECEKCKYEVDNDVCFCESCLDEKIQEAYSEGYKEAEKENNA